MAQDLKAAKRPYKAPSYQLLDDTTAKAELKAKGEPTDKNVQKMLSLVDGRR
jgi:hypothetical protein